MPFSSRILEIRFHTASVVSRHLDINQELAPTRVADLALITIAQPPGGVAAGPAPECVDAEHRAAGIAFPLDRCFQNRIAVESIVWLLVHHARPPRASNRASSRPAAKEIGQHTAKYSAATSG